MRFVTCGSSRLSADSFSCRAHCGVPDRITIPPPRPNATNAGSPGSRPASVIRRADSGKPAVVSKTVKSPTKPDTPSNRPRLSSKTVSGAALVLIVFGALAEGVLAPARARVAHHRALQRDGAPEGFGPERGQPAAVGDVVAQPLQQLVGQPQLAAGEGHPGRVAERRALVARQRQVGGEVVRQPLAVEPAQQRRHLGVEAPRQPPPANGRSTRTEPRTAAGRRSRRRRRPPRFSPCHVSAGQHHERARLAARRCAAAGPPPRAARRRAGAPARTRTTYTPVRIFDGTWMRKRPATRPPCSTRLRVAEPRHHEVEVAVDRAHLEVRDLARRRRRDSGPRSVKLLHRHARARPRHARGRRRQGRLGRGCRPCRARRR